MIGASSFDEKAVDFFHYQFTKAYLYRVFAGNLRGAPIQVVRLLGRDADYKLLPVTVRDIGENDHMLVCDDSVEATVICNRVTYELMITRYKESYIDDVRYVVAALGLTPGSKRPAHLLESVLNESMQHSPYKNHSVLVRPIEKRNGSSSEITNAEVESTSLADIFLPGSLKKYLRMYVDSIIRFDELQQPLRFLLCGKPGTAKTKIIRAIANEATGKATFIFTNGSDCVVDQVFDLADHLSPAVICIDDVDLLVGSRENESDRSSLASFLQKLDGFVSSAIFVLATTNDKNLVDVAASRPGRFDMVLDIDAIDPSQYTGLVKSKTKCLPVIDLFTDTVVDLLHARRATGAFVAALVKQLEVRLGLGDPTVGKDAVLETIELMNKGFYKKAESLSDKPGFRLS
jgi:hypothetical protein